MPEELLSQGPVSRPIRQPVAFRRDDPRALPSRDALRATLIAQLKRMPLDAISIPALVGEAGVGYATFFRHYADVEARTAVEYAAAAAKIAAE